jgi:hypothetical protein
MAIARYRVNTKREVNNMMKVLLVSIFMINFSFANCTDPADFNDILKCNWSNEALSFGLPPCDHCLGAGTDYPVGTSMNNPGLDEAFLERGADCTDFIEDDGSLGPYGETIDSYISNSSASSRFLNDGIPHIQEACSNWSNLNYDEKRHFWVWTFAAIAWDESTCKPSARNPRGTNGVAIGLLQLDEARGDRSWRGPNCRAQSVAAAHDNLRCGLDIMAELLLGPQGEYKGRGAIFIEGRRNTSYWQKLRTSNGGEIGHLIRTYPKCQN